MERCAELRGAPVGAPRPAEVAPLDESDAAVWEAPRGTEPAPHDGGAPADGPGRRGRR